MSREPIAKMFKKDLQPAMSNSAQESSEKDRQQSLHEIEEVTGDQEHFQCDVGDGSLI